MGESLNQSADRDLNLLNQSEASIDECDGKV
jgi:hypothetical protein